MKRAIFLICIISLHFAHAQDAATTLAMGNDLFKKGLYDAAMPLYKRVLFFDNEKQYAKDIYHNIAESLYQTNKPAEAADYFELAYFIAPSDSIKNHISLRRAACFLQLQQHKYAEVELYNLTDSLPASQQSMADFYMGIIQFANKDYESSEITFKKIAPDTAKISELFVRNKKIDRLKPKTAKILSIILPGLGQFYAGDIKNGLNSLLLSGGLFYLGINSAINNSLLDAAISVLPWYQRYYTGGFKRAEKIAEAKIKERRFKVYNALLDELNRIH